jgi:hypothetical protein
MTAPLVKWISKTMSMHVHQIWLGAESNRRHVDFQSTALPTELPSLLIAPRIGPARTVI